MTEYASIYESATIVSPNPLPADIDWQRVENTLGVKIEQGHPSIQEGNTSRLSPGVSNFDDVYRDARRDEDARVLRIRNLDPSTGSSVDRLLDAIEDGVQVFVVGNRELVRAINDLVSHDASIQSVDESPEPSDVDGSVSADPKKYRSHSE